MTYNLCKKVIQIGNYHKADMLQKLDIFLLNSRITQEQYEELISLIDGVLT